MSVLAVAATCAGTGRAGAATIAWRGRALGAEATIRLGGIGRARATATFAAVEAELARLEQIFSLHRAASVLAVLNRTGRLDRPPADLVAVLEMSDALHRATGGAFDPSVQPLWLARAGGMTAPARLGEVARRVGWRHLEFDAGAVVFRRPGMALTLNGIAQGHVTDRIAGVLRDRGFGDVLIDMGEIVALGKNHGAPWQAGITTVEGATVKTIALGDRALAVSAPRGTILGRGAASTGHILDPRPGAEAPRWQLVAVSAGSAALADGLSTGCCLLDTAAAVAAVAQFPGARLETLT